MSDILFLLKPYISENLRASLLNSIHQNKIFDGKLKAFKRTCKRKKTRDRQKQRKKDGNRSNKSIPNGNSPIHHFRPMNMPVR